MKILNLDDNYFFIGTAPCELPRIKNGDYTAGYRAGLTIANGSTVDYACVEPDYVKVNRGLVRCRLGELVPEYPACKTRLERVGYDGQLTIYNIGQFASFNHIAIIKCTTLICNIT